LYEDLLMSTKIYLILIFIGICFADYDANLAKRYVYYTGAAYCCPGDSCTKWTCGACRQVPGLIRVIALHNDTTDANGFIGVNPNGDGVSGPFIMIGFTGTKKSIKNWIDDINTIFVSYPHCSGCDVHLGFYSTYLSLQTQIKYALGTLLVDYPDFPVQITGHSLGAALAVHGTLDVLRLYPSAKIQTVYTFGQPRVGNYAFAQNFANSINSYRITHWMDPVPHLPPKVFGFEQNPTEVFYQEDNQDYLVCNGSGEDPNCSDQFPVDLDILDHLNYLGFDYTANESNC